MKQEDDQFWEEASKMAQSEAIRKQQTRQIREATLKYLGQQQVSNQENVKMTEEQQKALEIRQDFLWNIISFYTNLKTLKEIFMRPIPLQVSYVRCTIERNTNGLNKLFPVFILRLTDCNKVIMTASKLPHSATSHYKITVGQSTGDNPEGYLGRLRSNFKSTHFYLYGEGVRVNKQGKREDKKEEVCKQYLTLLYSDQNSKKTGKPMRSFETFIPMISSDPKKINSWTESEVLKKENIKLEYAQELAEERAFKQAGKKYRKNIIYFCSKTDFESLDFLGRVTQQSTKNFQLSDSTDSKKVFMQFGRAGPNAFNLDVAFPFSLFQAFAICLSTFDRQW